MIKVVKRFKNIVFSRNRNPQTESREEVMMPGDCDMPILESLEEGTQRDVEAAGPEELREVEEPEEPEQPAKVEEVDNRMITQSDSGKAGRLLRCIQDNTPPSEREPLLPVHNPREDVSTPGVLKAAMLLLKFIWNYVLNQCNRNFFYKYRVIFIIIALAIIVFVLSLTGNLAYLSVIGRYLICYLLNSLTNDDYHCYKLMD